MAISHNVGTVDRALRVVVGIILISLVFVGPKTAWGWLGLLPLATAIFRYCPPYSIFGWNTGAKDKTE